MKNGRRTMVALVVLSALLMAMLALPAVSLAHSYSSQELAFLNLINQYRQQNGSSPLLLSDMLSDAAQKHNSDMAKYSFFGHNSVQSDYFARNATTWDRMAACGYGYNTYKGENIAAGQSTAQAVFNAWKSSSGHNQNMLNANYQVIGISLVDAPGSAYRYYWTTDFGGYVDPTAHGGVTTTTARPTTTTTQPATTTTVRPTTTTTRQTTTTRPPTTPTTKPRSGAFPDVPAASPYYRAVTALKQANIIAGCDDGNFRPDDPTNRAQFAKIVCGGFSIPVRESLKCGFSDMGADDPDSLFPHDYVAAAAAAGITRGVTATRFDPWGDVTRAQVVTMIVRAADKYEPGSLREPPRGYSPGLPTTGDATHDRNLALAKYNGLLDGIPGLGMSWNAWAPAKRGEVALILWNAMENF